MKTTAELVFRDSNYLFDWQKEYLLLKLNAIQRYTAKFVPDPDRRTTTTLVIITEDASPSDLVSLGMLIQLYITASKELKNIREDLSIMKQIHSY